MIDGSSCVGSLNPAALFGRLGVMASPFSDFGDRSVPCLCRLRREGLPHLPCDLVVTSLSDVQVGRQVEEFC